MLNIQLPPSPENLPKGLTKLSGGYFFKASLAILAVFLFFLLYCSLIVFLGYVVYIAFTYNIGYVNKLTILGKIGAIAGAVMLFIFTLKFIFKLKNNQPENRILLTKSEHPNLITFIDDICVATGAPKPKRIYVDPDVNAYVAYTNMWLSLFLPVRKNLTIGMGLVASLNKSEFKAVISHEFGHFGQKSMKIGSYIFSANTIIHGMIYTRDRWDNTLEQWRQADLRLSFAAWIISPIIWIIRQVLKIFYTFLNLMHSLLSREMEFNADKVAVSTSGSTAIVSALWKLNYGAETWNFTMNNAYLASQKQLFVKNLYVQHILTAQSKEDIITGDYNQLSTDNLGVKCFFESNENSKVSMYASHPPNNLREKNAKSPLIECGIDKASAWEFLEI